MAPNIPIPAKKVHEIAHQYVWESHITSSAKHIPNIRIVEALYRAQDELLKARKTDKPYWDTIKSADNALNELGRERVSIETMGGGSLDSLAQVIQNKNKLKESLVFWESIDPVVISQIFARSEHLFGRDFILTELGMGNDIKALFVSALERLIETLDTLEGLGLTYEYLHEESERRVAAARQAHGLR